MTDYSVKLNTSTIQELADIINNKDNTLHFRDEAFKVLQDRASRDYMNFRLGLPSEQ